MPEISSAPRARLIDPTLSPALGTFTCGGQSAFEDEVNEIVADLHAGAVDGPVLVAEDTDNGRLIGVCLITQRPLPEPLIPDAAYIAVIAIHEDYRGQRLPDGTTPGDFLLHAALERIKVAWGGGPMPPVWALINPMNGSSHGLFERHGFALIPAAPGGYDIRYRARGRDV